MNRDGELWAELALIADDPDAIADRFYKDLEFGTGGLRSNSADNRIPVAVNQILELEGHRELWPTDRLKVS